MNIRSVYHARHLETWDCFTWRGPTTRFLATSGPRLARKFQPLLPPNKSTKCGLQGSNQGPFAWHENTVISLLVKAESLPLDRLRVCHFRVPLCASGAPLVCTNRFSHLCELSAHFRSSFSIDNLCNLPIFRFVSDACSVKVGDSFYERAQLCALGLHGQTMAGIDTVAANKNPYKTPIAVAIVLAGGYEDDVDNGDSFIYTGAGGKLTSQQALNPWTIEGTRNATFQR